MGKFFSHIEEKVKQGSDKYKAAFSLVAKIR
jgi:hypothetical protein